MVDPAYATAVAQRLYAAGVSAPMARTIVLSRTRILDRAMRRGDTPCDVAARLLTRMRRPQGLRVGDMIARITKAFGIKPCAACKRRQKKLNRMFA